MVAVALTCKIQARVVCIDDACQTLGTSLLSLSTRSSRLPSGVTKKEPIVEAGEASFELRSQPMQSANGESLLATSNSLSKAHAPVEDQKGLDPKLESEMKTQQSRHGAGAEHLPRHVGTENVTLATRVRFEPRNMTAQSPHQSAATQVHHNLQRARGTENTTLQAAMQQIDEQVHVVVEVARHTNSWFLIAVVVAILLGIMFAWRCFFSSESRIPVFDTLDDESYRLHEAWILHKPSSSGEKARSSNPVPIRKPDLKEPRSRLF